MEKPDRRIRRTQKSLHEALISLVLEKNYDSITVQEILDRADVGRATFYSHFKGKDDLLISGAHDLRDVLNSAVQSERSSLKSHDVVIGFSRAMFEHASEYRDVYHALLHTQGWSLFRERLEEIFDEIIRRECKAEIQRLMKADSDVPVDLFIQYVRTADFGTLIWPHFGRLIWLHLIYSDRSSYPVPASQGRGGRWTGDARWNCLNRSDGSTALG